MKRKRSPDSQPPRLPRPLPPKPSGAASATPTSSLPSLSYPPLHQPPKTTPPFSQPTPLLTFSYDTSHTQHFTDVSLRKLRPSPPIHADLNYGYERWTRRPDTKGRLDRLLTALARLEDVRPGLVTWRGVMMRLLTAPYEDRDTFSVNVMLVKGTLYVEEHLTDMQLRAKNDLAPKQRRQMYYGYSFESWSTCDLDAPPTSGLQWGGDVNTNEQWCVVAKTRLGSDRLVIGGEVDCVRDKYEGKTDNLVELKTSMVIRGAQDEARFEKKLLKFYFQSFLLGVPEIMVGFRTPQGQVTSVQAFKTMEIPRLVRGKPGAWDPRPCLAWGERLLRFVRETISPPRASKGRAPQAGTEDQKSNSGGANAGGGTGTPPPSEGEEKKLRGDREGDGEEERGIETPTNPPDDPERRIWRLTLIPSQGASLRLLSEEEVRDVQLEHGDSSDPNAAGGDGVVERVGFLPRWYFDALHTPHASAPSTSLPVRSDPTRVAHVAGRVAPPASNAHGSRNESDVAAAGDAGAPEWQF